MRRGFKQELFMKDGMLGLIVGDALGVPVEFMSREEIALRENGLVTGMESGGTYNMPEGTWSDDSSMALATLDSIKEKDEIDLDDIMEKFVQWNYKSKYTPNDFTFDVGRTCDEAIIHYKNNKDTKTCGRTGEYANGNGALMRILPVSVYWANKQAADKYATLTTEAIESIEKVGALTHNHKRSGIACGIHYFITKNILFYKNKLGLNEIIQKAIDEAFDFYNKDDSYKSDLVYYEELSDIEILRKYDSERIVGSGYVVESLIAAVWCLITTDSYKDCVLKAVNLGDDTDTTAAIAGGMAGLFYGREGMPSEWIYALKGYNTINNIIEPIISISDYKDSSHSYEVEYEKNVIRYEDDTREKMCAAVSANSIVTLNGSPDIVWDYKDWEEECKLSDSLEIALNRIREINPDGDDDWDYHIWVNVKGWYGDAFEIYPFALIIDRRIKKFLRYDELDFSDIKFRCGVAEFDKKSRMQRGLLDVNSYPQEVIQLFIDCGYKEYKSGELFNAWERIVEFRETEPEDFANPMQDKVKSTVMLTEGAFNDVRDIYWHHRPPRGGGPGIKDFNLITHIIFDLENTYMCDDLMACEPEFSRGIYKRIVNDYLITYLVDDGKVVVLALFSGMLGHFHNRVHKLGDDKGKPRIYEWI